MYSVNNDNTAHFLGMHNRRAVDPVMRDIWEDMKLEFTEIEERAETAEQNYEYQCRYVEQLRLHAIEVAEKAVEDREEIIAVEKEFHKKLVRIEELERTVAELQARLAIFECKPPVVVERKPLTLEDLDTSHIVETVAPSKYSRRQCRTDFGAEWCDP